MKTMDKNYIINDISNFTAYLYENLYINEKPETTEEVIRNYFQQTNYFDYDEYFEEEYIDGEYLDGEYYDGEHFDMKENEIVLKPHKPTQKEYELFWNE